MVGRYPDLAGKKVLITGAGSGIGAATAQRFLNEGATVFAVDINAQALAESWEQFPGDRLHQIVCDVTDYDAMISNYDKISRDHGAIDVVFANAGISIRHDLIDMSYKDWRRVIDVNLHGVFHTVMPAARIMHAAGSGSIIMMGSTNGMSAHKHYADYNVSKAGVIMLARSMALELAPVVRVNAICPGYVLTPMQKAEYTADMLRAVDQKIPLGRHADPAEVAALVAFLASSEASYLTGTQIPIDGGETA
ncbi:SDR family NAD(P)-dependent oxidoreductase [Rhizobium skierniewicense]|uniref:SDR family NAD(P)-dependent oxidoreductase n=1 Tax=Rhizobium skierniewicense TaxID=984260 RepID=UPI0015B5B232|nr:SDR family NAD(P)-dependent oxidoreductase [Rhizobium skierniewicense]